VRKNVLACVAKNCGKLSLIYNVQPVQSQKEGKQMSALIGIVTIIGVELFLLGVFLWSANDQRDIVIVELKKIRKLLESK